HRERRRALELRARLVGAAELEEQVAADGGKQVVVLEGGRVPERVDSLEPGLRPERPPDGDGAVQLAGGRGRDPGERVVEGHDAGPGGLLGGGRLRMARGDRGLEDVGARLTAGCAGAFERAL